MGQAAKSGAETRQQIAGRVFQVDQHPNRPKCLVIWSVSPDGQIVKRMFRPGSGWVVRHRWPAPSGEARAEEKQGVRERIETLRDDALTAAEYAQLAAVRGEDEHAERLRRKDQRLRRKADRLEADEG